MGKRVTIFDEVVSASRLYLGPVAERFISRQIRTHLGIKPEELTQKDIPKLVEWTKLAFTMLTDNEDQIQAFAKTLLEIGTVSSGKAPSSYAKSN